MIINLTPDGDLSQNLGLWKLDLNNAPGKSDSVTFKIPESWNGTLLRLTVAAEPNDVGIIIPTSNDAVNILRAIAVLSDRWRM